MASSNKILIIGNLLRIGGAEKLIYEIVCFARANAIEPEILILDNYEKEHYDEVYARIGVRVTRTRLDNIKHFRAPLKMLRSLIWLIKLKFFAGSGYASVHVIGLYNLYRVIGKLKHPKRFFWNVNNAIQFPGRKYPYPAEYFANTDDTIVCINRFQLIEMNEQYGAGALKAKLSLFKLFMAE